MVADERASGGSISPTTGLYTAGTTGNTKDTVRVQDALGNAATVDVLIGPGLVLMPEEANVVAGATVVFSAAGGSGAGYTFQLDPNASGGSIGADGVYTAGPNGGDDVVRLTDTLGNVDTTTVHVTAVPPSAPPSGNGASSSSSGGSEPVSVGGDGGANEGGCSLTAGPAQGHGIVALVLGLGLALVRRRR